MGQLEKELPDLTKEYGPGKFTVARDQYLYCLSMDGCDQECGNSCEGPAWYGLLSGPFDHAQLAGIAGAIVCETSDGFVYSDTYETTADLMAAWKQIEEANPEVEE